MSVDTTRSHEITLTVGGPGVRLLLPDGRPVDVYVPELRRAGKVAVGIDAARSIPIARSELLEAQR